MEAAERKRLARRSLAENQKPKEACPMTDPSFSHDKSWAAAPTVLSRRQKARGKILR
jgi:hypothetical protein